MRYLHGGLSTRSLVHILCEAANFITPTVVRVVGPVAIAGSYVKCDRPGVHTEFVRRGAFAGAQLVLLRVEREADNFFIHWDGMPLDELRRAGAEWKIQARASDPRDDRPIAVTIDPATDAWGLTLPWWLWRGGVFIEANVHVIVEEVEEQQARPIVHAVVTWARAGGSLRKLATVAAACRDHRSAVIWQLCKLAA